MAKIDWKEPTIKAAIVVAGGSLLSTYLVPSVPFVGDLLGKLPAVAGIDLGLVVLGSISLIAYKYFTK